MKLGLVSLGCDKNTVDSERMLSALADQGAVYTRDLSEAEVILVNTCGFIDAAKEESIETLLEMGRMKDGGRVPGRGRSRMSGRAVPGRAPAWLCRRWTCSSGLTGHAPAGTGAGASWVYLIPIVHDSPRRADFSHRAPARSLPEDQRGLRPRLRVLRYPPLEGKAPVVRGGSIGC